MTAASRAAQGTTIGALLRRQAAARAEATYFVTEHERLTYGAAEQRSQELARGLVAAGAGRGDRIALLFSTGSPSIVAWLAAVRIGAVAVPLSTFSTPEELGQLLRLSDATMLLGEPGYRGHDYVDGLTAVLDGVDLGQPGPVMTPSAPSLRHVHLAGGDPRVHRAHTLDALVELGAGLGDPFLDAVEADVHPDDRMAIVHTSGSTAAPKGVVHCHGPLIRHLERLNELRGLSEGVKLFSASPLFWIGGLAYNLVGTLVAGATLVYPTSSDAGESLDLIERERPELVSGFDRSVAALAAHPTFAARDLSSIRSGNLYTIMAGGVRPADPGLRHNMLGMTEAGSVCLMSDDEGDQPEHRRGSFGRAVPGLAARVVDPGTGDDCATDEVGELWFRGPAMMEGYYGRERWDAFTPDQWFRTGDFASVDGEGFVYFKGRRGDMIKTAGANVSPREVEAVVRDASGGWDVVVLGIPDDERGQIVAAVILAPAGAPVDLAAVDDAVRRRLSAYKRPRTVVRIDPADLPVHSSGKPDLERLVEVVRGA